MRLKSIYISNYKNLNKFSLTFDGNSFIDIFVGKNGSGKSNLFEALIEIFRHLYEFDKTSESLGFEYEIEYLMNESSYKIQWEDKQLRVNGDERKSINKSILPDNVLIYYSGHNKTVTELVNSYQDKFSKRIKKADFDESRRFIGIGAEYKGLLLAILLLQDNDCKARQFVCKTLGIQSDISGVKLVLKRPVFAKKNFEIEGFDTTTHFWGTAGITKGFLSQLQECIKNEFKHSDIYHSASDTYSIEINRELYQSVFKDCETTEQFRLFDNLKTLEMLEEISAPVVLENGVNADISQFSDGQFQSVYINSIIELFKDRNCITLLDEPDAFLHPEWQYKFLEQVFEITDTTANNNHVLMSSHSAVTLIPHDRKKIKFFDIKDNHTNCYDLPKSIAINKLSSALIRYSEQDQLLSIINTIQIENKPVLFTEGSTDPIILKEAWYKLFDEDMPFIPFYAFSCTYIKQLLTDNRIHAEMGGLPIFALFDFDKAYDQWNGLNGVVIENDPFKGKIKKWDEGESYAIMIPIPSNADIQKQVIKVAATKETYGGSSCCEIEHLFYGQTATAAYYQAEPCPGGTQIVFKNDSEKTSFAKEVIHLLDSSCFEAFRPMFEFIKSKCSA